MAAELIDTPCPVCGEMPGISGQRVGDRRYWPDCVIDDGAGGYRPMTPEEHGFPAEPEPTHSGQFRVRIPTDLHAALAAEAARQSVSLNTLVVGLLAGGIRWNAR